MDVPIRDVTVFTKNHDRLLAGDIAARFLSAIIGHPRVQALMSDDHFSVGGPGDDGGDGPSGRNAERDPPWEGRLPE